MSLGRVAGVQRDVGGVAVMAVGHQQPRVGQPVA